MSTKFHSGKAVFIHCVDKRLETDRIWSCSTTVCSINRVLLLFRLQLKIMFQPGFTFGQAMTTTKTVIWFLPAIDTVTYRTRICQLLLHTLWTMYFTCQSFF